MVINVVGILLKCKEIKQKEKKTATEKIEKSHTKHNNTQTYLRIHFA